jgi:hypothetical protein
VPSFQARRGTSDGWRKFAGSREGLEFRLACRVVSFRIATWVF